MELAVVGMALLRRWYVTLAGLLATSGLVYLAYTALPPTYSASGSVLLLPASASVESGANPLLQLGGLEQPTSLVIAYLAGNDAREEFAVEHPDVTYDIVLDPLARGPVILITVEGPTAGQTVAGLNAALDTVPDALATLQDRVDAPASAQIRSRPLTVDPAAETVWTSTLRALIGAAGVGGAATLGAAVIVDSFSRRRKDRRAALAAADSRDAREVTEFASRGAEDPHAGPAEPSWDPQAAGWPAVASVDLRPLPELGPEPGVVVHREPERRDPPAADALGDGPEDRPAVTRDDERRADAATPTLLAVDRRSAGPEDHERVGSATRRTGHDARVGHDR